MYLGIDLGTSNSAIVGNDGSELKLFKTSEGHDVLSTAIYVNKQGHRFVGERAYKMAATSPQNVATGFKRLMGTNSTISLCAAGADVTPEACSTEIIKTLLRQAMTATGQRDISGAVVTIPAAFNQMQSEATIRSARASGLSRVGLLQEPIAAAMAAMVKDTSRSGDFLVYDIGGGTFDVALVGSDRGTVNVIAHEGINMLGGRDFDRMLVHEVVRPALLDSFALPRDFLLDERYRRLVGIARHAVEMAKISLSSVEKAMIFADDEEVQLKDEDGKDIYLSIELTRIVLERVISGRLAPTLELCRKVLKDNGYRPSDINRMVLIGGPSKMPIIRNQLPRDLGIPADLDTDPMTAVANGAAIYCESRDWGGEKTTRKSGRGAVSSTGPVGLRCVFPARVADDRAGIRVSCSASTGQGALSVVIDGPEGWTSGVVELDDEVRLNVPVPKRGENNYRITAYGDSNELLEEACSEFSIFRTHASAAGIPATHTLAVKIVGDLKQGNTLAALIEKGTMLPASGSRVFRAAKELRGGDSDSIDIEFFEQAAGVPEPELNLSVGSFQLKAKDLEAGDLIRKGDEVKIHWEMDDNGLLRCTVEVEAIGRSYETGNFYTSTTGHHDFSGDEGESLAEAVLREAEKDLDDVEQALGTGVRGNAERLRGEVSRQRTTLDHSGDADTRRAVFENARAVRQEVSRIRHDPQHRSAVLTRELEGLQHTFESEARAHADQTSRELFSRLIRTAEQSITAGDFVEAERALDELRLILYRALWQSPEYLVYWLTTMSLETHLAIDKEEHALLVTEAQEVISLEDVDRMRQVGFCMLENRFAIAPGDSAISALADLMGR